MQTVRSGEPECLSTLTVYHNEQRAAFLPAMNGQGFLPQEPVISRNMRYTGGLLLGSSR